MFTTIARKVVTLTVAAATVATLSLSVVTPAQAGMFDFSVDITGPLMIHNHEDNIDYQSQFEFGPKFYDKQWDMLNEEDNRLHVVIDNTKLTDDLQHQHDCLYAKKIKALLQEMKTNLKHYQRRMQQHIQDKRLDLVPEDMRVIGDEAADIAKWEAELDKALEACRN